MGVGEEEEWGERGGAGASEGTRLESIATGTATAVDGQAGRHVRGIRERDVDREVAGPKAEHGAAGCDARWRSGMGHPRGDREEAARRKIQEKRRLKLGGCDSEVDRRKYDRYNPQRHKYKDLRGRGYWFRLPLLR